MFQEIDFDDSFAAAHDYARMYRALGLQVVPAKLPKPGESWKRPITDWSEFQTTLIPETQFDRWYGAEGQYRQHSNMGLITGAASGGVFCVDLDVKAGSQAMQRWAGLIAVHNNGIEIETPTQRTGGGGLQILFRAPAGWVPPTFKTPIGIDIRGQGGFMMCPPSLHESGARYDWVAGKAVWQVEIVEAGEWLIEWIEQLHEEHGGQPSGERRERTAAAGEKNAFGLDTDGREQKLADWVWACVVDLYRDSPIPPGQAEQETAKQSLWERYLRSTKSRLPAREGATNADLLEIEGRGLSELNRKWRYAMKKWGSEVKAAADERPARAAHQDQAEEEPAASHSGEKRAYPFRITEYGDIVDEHHKDWVIDDIIGDGEMSVFYGAPGCGKSVVVGDAAAHVAAGLPWMGRPVRVCGVLYLAAERGALVKRRLAAWRRKHGMAELPLAVAEGVFDLCNSEAHAKSIVEIVQDLSAEWGVPIGWIIIDTKAQVMAGGDPNSDKDVGGFLHNVRLLQDTGAHVSVVDHIPHSSPDRIKGSGALGGAADASYYIRKEGDVRLLTIGSKPPNDGPDELQIAFKLESVVLGVSPLGKETTAPVVVPATFSSSLDPNTQLGKDKRGRDKKLSDAAQVVRSAYGRLYDEGKTHSPPAVPGVRPGSRAVTEAALRATAYDMNVGGARPGDDAEPLDIKRFKDRQKSNYSNGFDQLVNVGVFRAEQGFVWEVYPGENEGI